MDPVLDHSNAIDVAKKHRSLILYVFISVLILTSLITLLLPAKYSSTMNILVRSSPKDLAATPDRAESLPTMEVSEAEVNSEVELLTGYGVLRTAVVENHLDQGGLFSSGNDEKRVDAAVRKLAKSLTVTPVRKANIIQVEYLAKSPQLAASVLRSIEAAYLEVHLKSQSTPGGFAFFRKQADYYGTILAQDQQKLSDLRRSQEIADLPEQRTLLTQTLVDRQSALQSSDVLIAQLKKEIAESRTLERTTAPRLATASRSGPNQYSVDHLTALLADLRNRRTLLLSKFRDDDPFITEVDAEIDQTRGALAAAKSGGVLEQASDVNPALQTLQIARRGKEVELQGEEARHKVLAQQVQSLNRTLNRLSSLAGEYSLLTSAVQQSQENYVNFSKRREQARVSEQLDQNKITNVVIAQQPTESLLPLQSRGILGFLLGVVLAALAAAVAAFAAENFRLPGSRESVRAL